MQLIISSNFTTRYLNSKEFDCKISALFITLTLMADSHYNIVIFGGSRNLN